MKKKMSLLKGSQPMESMDTLLTIVLQTSFSPSIKASSFSRGLAQGYPQLHALNCNSLMIPYESVFAGEISVSLLVLSHNSQAAHVLMVTINMVLRIFKFTKFFKVVFPAGRGLFFRSYKNKNLKI